MQVQKVLDQAMVRGRVHDAGLGGEGRAPTLLQGGRWQEESESGKVKKERKWKWKGGHRLSCKEESERQQRGWHFCICLFLLNITVWIRRTYIYRCWRIQDGYIYHSAQGSQAEAETLLLLEVRRGPCLTFPVPCVCSYRKLQKLNLLFWFSLQSGEIPWGHHNHNYKRKVLCTL